MTKVSFAANDDDKPKESMWTWMVGMSTQLVSGGLSLFQWAYMNGKHIGWFIVTTGMITALPLIFEVKREAMVEEMEKMQIGAALQEGRSPQELAASGLTAAIEPAVLK